MDLNIYKDFVDGITSKPSKDNRFFVERILELDEQGVEISRLLTAAVGLPGEVGEFSDIVKKVMFHGKELTPELREKLEKEAGDIAWYWIQACIGLGVDPYVILQKNMDKLNKRYEGGVFTVEASENRKSNDV